MASSHAPDAAVDRNPKDHVKPTIDNKQKAPRAVEEGKLAAQLPEKFSLVPVSDPQERLSGLIKTERLLAPKNWLEHDEDAELFIQIVAKSFDWSIAELHMGRMTNALLKDLLLPISEASCKYFLSIFYISRDKF